VSPRILPAGEAFWRPSNQMGVLNTDLAKQLEADALWLVVGTPPEPANTLEMTAEQLAELYPDGPQALPPELG
jgi:hypothetical protein